MSNLGQLIDEFVSWLRTTPFTAYADAITYQPVDFDAYDGVYEQIGFPLPKSLAQFVAERGLLCIPCLPGEFRHGALGFVMEPPHRVFQNYLHMEAAVAQGVEQHSHWLVFATLAGDVEPAFAFDDRFRAQGEYEVGFYHQDEVYYADHGPNEHLPYAAPTIAAWLKGFLDDARRVLSESDETEMVAAIRNVSPVHDLSQRTAKVHPSDWQAAHAESLQWGRGASWAFRLALRRSGDMRAVENILKEIDQDLAGVGRRETIPGLTALKEGKTGAWPWDYPGPRDLLYRLPDRGEWSRRRFVQWALHHAGHTPTNELLQIAEANVDALCTGEDTREGRDVGKLAQLARHCESLSDLDRNYAWALIWASGPQDPDFMHEAILRIIQVAYIANDRRLAPLNLVTVYQKLAAIVRGQTDFEPRVLRKESPRSSGLEALSTDLADFTGPQRDLLERLKADWLPRLKQLSVDDRQSAIKLIRHKIKSKKLIGARDDLLAQIDI